MSESDAHKDAQQSARDTKDAARGTQDAVDKAGAEHLGALNERQTVEEHMHEVEQAKDARVAQALIDELEHATQRKEFWLRIALVFVGVFIVLSVVLIGYVVSAVRETQLEGSPSQKVLLDAAADQKKILERLTDCTTPGGKCNTELEAQRGSAVQIINEATVHAIACGNRHPEGSVPVIQRCVNDLYEKNNDDPEKK